MAEEETNEADTEAQVEEGAEEEGGDKKKLIIIAAIVALLLGVGAGLYFTGVIGGGDKAEEVHEDDEHGEGHDEGHDKKGDGYDDGHGKDDHGKGDKKGDKKAKGKKGKDDHGKDDGHGKGGYSAFFPMPSMNISLRTDDGVPRFLRLSVQLELQDPADAAAIEAIMPRVVDRFQTYLRELRVKDLRGSGGIYRLQMELLWRVNQAAAPVQVKDVLFQEILIQ